jgi:hypothetical protein
LTTDPLSYFIDGYSKQAVDQLIRPNTFRLSMHARDLALTFAAATSHCVRRACSVTGGDFGAVSMTLLLLLQSASAIEH